MNEIKKSSQIIVVQEQRWNKIPKENLRSGFPRICKKILRSLKQETRERVGETTSWS